MTTSALQFIERLVQRIRRDAGRLVIDADTHITDLGSLSLAKRRRHAASLNYYHGRSISAEDLVAEMEMADVDMALCWQNPAATEYTGDSAENARALLEANRYVRDAALRHPGRIIPGGWVDPRASGLDRALEMTEVLVREFGFLFIKMNPAQNRYPIDACEVIAVVDYIVELGAIPAFHFGADTSFTPARGLRSIVERHPEHPVLAVHMGGGGASYVEADGLYGEARQLGLECTGVRFALSARRDTHMESDLITYQLAGEPFCRHLCCASDAPYGRMTWNFGGFRAMFESLIDGERHTDARVRANPGLFTPEVVQNYLGGNFAHLVVEGYERLLATHRVESHACR